jgi:hypothetical protein
MSDPVSDPEPANTNLAEIIAAEMICWNARVSRILLASHHYDSYYDTSYDNTKRSKLELELKLSARACLLLVFKKDIQSS